MSAKFFKAIQEGDKDKVERMLRKTPDLILAKSKKNLSPLLTAMYYHEFEIAELLLDRMVKLTVYEAAATGKMTHLISNLGHKPELVNAYSEDGYQPLGLAAYFGHEKVVEYLIKAGAEVNSPSKNALGVTLGGGSQVGCIRGPDQGHVKGCQHQDAGDNGQDCAPIEAARFLFFR